MGIKPKYVGGSSPRSLMLIRPGALGDTLMLAPSICDLGDLCPVEFVGRHPGLYFISMIADNVSDMEAGAWHRLFVNAFEERQDSVGGLRDKPPAFVVAFMGDSDRVLEMNLKFVFPGASVNIFPSLPPEGSPSIHVAYYTAQCLKDAGLPVDPERAIERALTKPLLPRIAEGPRGCSYPLIHPGSGSLKKNYPPEFWIKLIEVINSIGFTASTAPRVLIGPAEYEMAKEFQNMQKTNRCLLEITEDKSMLHGFLSNSAFYIGHDSGVTHLAALMGIPAVALFRESDPLLWRPLGPKVTVLCGRSDPEDLLGKVGKLLSCNNELSRI